MLTLEDKPRRRLKSLLDFSIIRYWWDTWSKANSHGIGWILYINIDKFKRTLLNCLFHLFLTGNLNSEPALWRETSRNHKCQQPRRDLCPRFQRIGTIIHVKRRRPQRAKKTQFFEYQGSWSCWAGSCHRVTPDFAHLLASVELVFRGTFS